MGREPKTEMIAGLEVTSMPLPFSQAEPLLPEMAELLALGIKALTESFSGLDLKTLSMATIDMSRIAPALAAVATYFGQGRLSRLAPKLLATTTVVFEDIAGEREIKDLSKAKDRELVFDEHPEAYLPILWSAGRLSFQRFFPESALLGAKA